MTIDVIKRLYYKDGLSAREVGEKLGKTVWQIIRFMKRNNLSLRSAAQTQKIQFSKKPLSFKIINSFSLKNKLLHQAGLMLYWAEGSKTNNGTVDLANSNEEMIMLFLIMLRKIYRVNEKRIRILIYCYANQNTQTLIHYWSKKLHIPRNQFIKPYIRLDYKPSKTYKMPHGLVHVRYNDKKLFMKIWEEIGIISSRLIKSWDGGVVKRTSL